MCRPHPTRHRCPKRPRRRADRDLSPRRVDPPCSIDRRQANRNRQKREPTARRSQSIPPSQRLLTDACPLKPGSILTFARNRRSHHRSRPALGRCAAAVRLQARTQASNHAQCPKAQASRRVGASAFAASHRAFIDLSAFGQRALPFACPRYLLSRPDRAASSVRPAMRGQPAHRGAGERAPEHAARKL